MNELMSRLKVSITGPLVSSMSSILPPKTKPSREVAKKEMETQGNVSFGCISILDTMRLRLLGSEVAWSPAPPPRHKKVQQPAPQPGSWLLVCGAFGENLETHPTWPIKLSLPELLSLSPLLPDVV